MARNFGDWDNVAVNTNNDSMQMNLGDKTVLNLSSSLTATVTFLSATNRIYAPGGFADCFTYYKSFLTTNESCAMTASTINSGSGGFYKVYLKTPMVRGGSVLGLVLYSESSNIQAGAVSASVMIDGVNITNNATGSWLILSASGQQSAAILYSPYVYTFSGTQSIGVSLTGASYVTGSVGGGVGGNWAATVMVEV